ncbi:MAG: hypothetical protein KAZ63_00690 [Vitreoscilla sp.]|nr:hypothetical protein [Vitreoscilla sp.]
MSFPRTIAAALEVSVFKRPFPSRWHPEPQVCEDLLDHRLLQDRRDDLRAAAAVRAVLHVEAEHAVDAGDAGSST